MMMNTIWERYFLREITKVFALFLLCFYGLYVLIDYSNHSSSFQNYHFKFLDIVRFYGFEFLIRMDVLVPFAILIATIKTLCALNRHNELIALMASGIKLKRLLFPFVAFGLLFTLIIFFNTEWLLPHAKKYHQKYEQTRAKAKQKKHHHLEIQQLQLEDSSSLIFQQYDNENEQFFDAYWIRSIDDIYRIRTLALRTSTPTGTHVEHLQRDENGNLVVTESIEQRAFPDIHFNTESLLDSVVSPDDQSVSSLKEKLPINREILSEKEARVLTSFYYKLALPWLCLLAVMAPAPFCTTFSRSLPIFLIYAFSLFGLVAFYLVMDAAVILGERQVVSPAVAIWVPFSCFFAFFGYRFAKT